MSAGNRTETERLSSDAAAGRSLHHHSPPDPAQLPWALRPAPPHPLIGWRLLQEKEVTLVHVGGTSAESCQPSPAPPGQGAHIRASAHHRAVFLTVWAADSCITRLPCCGPGILTGDLGDFKVPEGLKQLFCTISPLPSSQKFMRGSTEAAKGDMAYLRLQSKLVGTSG